MQNNGCLTCKHIDKKTLTCKAFANGIPWIIISGTIDHFSPFPGDNGIQFEPIVKDDTDASINRNQGR